MAYPEPYHSTETKGVKNLQKSLFRRRALLGRPSPVQALLLGRPHRGVSSTGVGNHSGKTVGHDIGGGHEDLPALGEVVRRRIDLDDLAGGQNLLS